MVKLPKIIFVTGTDTEVGKTWLTCTLVRYLRSCDLCVKAIKPFCSGPRDDVMSLLQANREYGSDSPDKLNPWYFREPLSPYACCLKEKKPFPVLSEVKDFILSQSEETDVLLVEGAGGIATPIGPGFLLGDIINEVAHQVVLTVPDKLGCLNHTVLSIQYLQKTFRDNEIFVCMSEIEPKISKKSLNHKIISDLLPSKTIGFLPFLTQIPDVDDFLEKKIKKPLAVFSEFGRLLVPSQKGDGPKEAQ